MIKVSFANEEITVKRIKKTPPQLKEIEATDGNTYRVKVPGSVKTNVEFTLTHKGILTKDDMPTEIKNEFSEIELEMILDKQKKAIQKTLAKNMPTCSAQIGFLLNYKDFIEGGQEVETLADKIKELQIVLKKK